MRIPEAQTRSGFFWLPSEPEQKLPGTLTIQDGGRIEVDVLGTFGKGGSLLFEELHLPRIVGIVEQGGLITLDGCYYKSRKSSLGGIAKTLIIARRLYEGIQYDADESVLLSMLRFSVEGLDEWLGLSGIRTQVDHTKRTATIDYVPQKEISINLVDGFQMGFCFSWTLPGWPVITEAKVTQKAYIRLTSDKPAPLDDFISLAYKITNFLCFAIDRTVSINAMLGGIPSQEIDNAEKEDGLHTVRIIYESLPFSDYVPKARWRSMLFRFSRIRETADSIFHCWLVAYDVFQPALDLYFSSRAGAHKYVNGRFLSLAQALETYHRRTSGEATMDGETYRLLVLSILILVPEEHRVWLAGRLAHGNEINFSTRLKRMIEPFKQLFGNSESQKRLVRKIVDNRNYLTHYNQELRSRAASGSELLSLCMKMEAILQLHFLGKIGFSEEQIFDICNESETLKAKLEGQAVS